MLPSSSRFPVPIRAGPRASAAFMPAGDTSLDLDAAISRGLTETATRICDLSVNRWGEDKAVALIGRDPRFVAMLAKVEKFGRFHEPILITGESGVGKELIAKACYLLSGRMEHPFVSVNCPQFDDGNTTVSELFGHVRGSFTGAHADHTGLFESAGQGVLFLDEIGDLPLPIQVLLLRALAEGEFKSLGSSETKKFHARFITATNQHLAERMNAKEFREDLFFRLRYFRLEVPPLRDRGEDWRLLLDVSLARLNAQHSTRKRFSDEALETLGEYRWPGNVRELRGIVSMGYSLSEGNTIALADFYSELRPESMGAGPSSPLKLPAAPARHAPESKAADETEVQSLYQQVVSGQTGFWDGVYTRFMERELNRDQVKTIIAQGLRDCRGSYRRLCQHLHVDVDSYQKFMDFLRHHRLKP